MYIESIRKELTDRRRENTQMVVELLRRDFDLSQLETIFSPTIAEIYQRQIPRYAQLCEIDQTRSLTEIERCDLAVSYASLYYTFGHEGIVIVSAHYLATRPHRQSRDN